MSVPRIDLLRIVVLLQQERLARQQKRLTGLVQMDDEQVRKLESEAIEKSKLGANNITGKYSAWRRDPDYENPDALARLMRDQLIMARVYSYIAQSQRDFEFLNNLKLRIKEHIFALGDVTSDAELPSG